MARRTGAVASYTWRGDEFFKATKKHMKKNLKRTVIFLQKEAKKYVYGKSGMKRGVGALRRSIDWEVNGLSGRYGSNLRYARVHEEGTDKMLGGPITPKNVTYLSIPLTAKARRYSSPRDMPDDLQFIPLKGRNPILVTMDENFEIKEVHWVLVKEVTIPPRPYLRPVLYRNKVAILKRLLKPMGKGVKWGGGIIK